MQRSGPVQTHGCKRGSIGTIAIAKWDNAFDVEACEREIAAMKHEKAMRKALLAQK
ncbi:hypothetical protein [Pseudomonas sp. BP8]|uniref:hypothetical protein n=1 Tax=Pseudomonas sp. BP8 TaxID=2817864 RepID=UPI001AE8A6BF|nr:hypothetical protein [Pseudomonas sp. BP8]MBP2261931.1 hypothetical protein [Pseudomonas sp. BP8]HDS1737191.1 hypothetical protein [Pseudomonas putida]